MNYRDKMEIDLIDLLHQLLLKWRQALACMLVGMILVGIYGYNKKVQVVIDDNTGEVVEASVVDDKSLASLGSKLSTNEKKEAVLAVDAYLDYEKSYSDRQKVGESQVTMKYDAFHVPNYIYNYRISDYDFDNVPEMSTVTNVDNIVALYRNSIYDQSVIAEIKEVNGWDYEDGFIKETYFIGKTGLDIMVITANAPSKEECENIIKIIDTKINSAYSDVDGEYPHSLKRVQTTYYESYSSSILDQQRTQIENLVAIEKAMQQVSSAMTADQKAYYTALLNAVKTESEQGEAIDPLTIAKREAGKESEVIDAVALAASSSETQVKSDESDQSVVMVPSRRISLKYIALGALAALFLMCCFYGVLYVLSPKLRTKSDIQDGFHVAVLGEIKDDNRYTRPMSGVDRFIDTLFEKKDGKLTTVERMEMITAAICLGLKKSEIKSVYITGAGVDETIDEFRARLVSCIENSSVNDGNFSFDSDVSPLVSPDSLKNLSLSDSVVLVEKIGTSRYDDIVKMLDVCCKFGVKVLGTVLID